MTKTISIDDPRLHEKYTLLKMRVGAKSHQQLLDAIYKMISAHRMKDEIKGFIKS